MVEKLRYQVDISKFPNIETVDPPFASDSDVAMMLHNARARYTQQLVHSGILAIPYSKLSKPSDEIIQSLSGFRGHAVRYRSVMWICGAGEARSKFDPAFYGLPGHEEDFIYFLGRYKDATLGYGGRVQEATRDLAPVIPHVQLNDSEGMLQAVPHMVAMVRLSHVISRIEDLSLDSTFSDRQMHDLRILLRVLRDIYSVPEIDTYNGSQKQFVSSLDDIQRACNIWRRYGTSIPREQHVEIRGRRLNRKILPAEISGSCQEIVATLRRSYE